jgi:hypothetical protein
MKMLKKSIYTLVPSLAFLTFKSKGGGGGTTTTKLDPEVRDRIMMPSFTAVERGAGATPNFDAKGNFLNYTFDDYEGYGGNQLTDWTSNDYYATALAPETLTAIGEFGGVQHANANQRYTDLMNYGGPDNIATHFAGAPDSLQATGVTGANVTKDAFGIMTPQVRGNVRDVNAGTFPGADISQYTNPYQSEVIDTTLDALDRQRQIQQQQNAAGATQAGAFGGSRHGVVEAETNRAYADQAARTAASLNSQGFDTAAGLQQADADRAMSAGLANQGVDQAITSQALDLAGQFGLANQSADLQAGAINYGGELDTSLANANAVNTAAIHDADLDLASKELNLGAGGQLMDLVAQGRDAHQSNLETLMTAGDFIDDRGQMGLDLDYQKWLDEQNHELNQANVLQGGASSYPIETITKNLGGKIICTMMNESYGFGHFRNQIWLEQSANLDPAIERGYHKIFLPVIAFAKGDGWMSRVARKIMEHGARHRTADIWKQKRGKRDRVGQVYRLVFEPICYVVGKLIKEK